MTDLLIEGDPRELEAIRVEIERELGREAMLETVTSAQPGQMREPILVGVIVALGGPVIVRAVVEILRNRQIHAEEMGKQSLTAEQMRLDHEARMREMDLTAGGSHVPRAPMSLKLIEGDEEREIDLDSLGALA